VSWALFAAQPAALYPASLVFPCLLELGRIIGYEWFKCVFWIVCRQRKDLLQLSADDIERWFAELANSTSVLRRHELVERIAAAVSRFVMIDEDILCPSLFESLKGARGKEDMETSPTSLL
jgi:hypothetical protein